MTTLFFFFLRKRWALKNFTRISYLYIYIYIYLLLEYFTILNIKVTNLFDVSRHFFGIFFKIRTLKFAKRKNYRSVRRKAIVRLVRCREIVNTEADGELASNGTSTRYRSTYHIRPALKRRISVDTIGPNNGTTGLRYERCNVSPPPRERILESLLRNRTNIASEIFFIRELQVNNFSYATRIRFVTRIYRETIICRVTYN